MRNLTSLIYLLLLSVLSSQFLYPQSPKLINYTNTDFVWQVTIQNDSVLWLATTGGLERIGISSTPTYKIYGYTGDVTNAVAVDPKGNVWVSTNTNGLFEIKDTLEQHYTVANTDSGLSSRFINTITTDKSGNIWIGTFNGVSELINNNWSHYLAGKTVYAITVESPDSIWFGQMLLHNGSVIDHSDSCQGMVVKVLIDASGNKWFVTYNNGVYEFLSNHWTHYTPQVIGIGSNNISDAALDTSGNIWLATNGGLIYFDGTEWNTITKDNGLPSDSVSSIIVDRENNKWIGTYRKGLWRYDGSSWKPFIPNEISSTSVLKILVDKLGNVWAASGKDICEFNKKEWTTYNLPSNIITGLAEDSSGHLWACSFNGEIWRFNGSKWDSISSAPQFTTSLQIDETGNVWVGTMNNGLQRFSPSTFQWTAYNQSNSGLASNMVYDIALDDSGNIWCATYHGGVNKFDSKNWIIYDSTNSIVPSLGNQYIMSDHRGSLWMSNIINRSLYKFNGQKWIRFDTTRSILGYNIVMDVTVDSSGTYWFATSGGIFRFDGKNLTNYTSSDGLLSNSTTSISIDKNGNKWIASSYDPDFEMYQLLGVPPPLPGIGGISVFNENGIVTNIMNTGTGQGQVPPGYILFQNYPNPFNPTTTIGFQLAQRAQVNLKIFNLLGQEVQSLNLGNMSGGLHDTTINMVGFASGVYFYILKVIPISHKSSTFVSTKKMILLK